ncbi:MAG: hypothetical protein B7Y25_06440 [Alphaproteobacteria bacterium 16-39-46]|nr:MAG: hypothetical protein B7Y25_06440 [Alphaproteobacteria bacterium 16-39-46]OZA42275.1 MAG: hypothetical protein B7X84_06510 [Alphaproteobacteria bacterium 17-39-52]HQS84056.1 hypothetical protein [Alphaproteobacteria bacterium]HQS93918.1 hypothetical protein [Alphaproteobacteria bacterium]
MYQKILKLVSLFSITMFLTNCPKNKNGLEDFNNPPENLNQIEREQELNRQQHDLEMKFKLQQQELEIGRIQSHRLAEEGRRRHHDIERLNHQRHQAEEIERLRRLKATEDRRKYHTQQSERETLDRQHRQELLRKDLPQKETLRREAEDARLYQETLDIERAQQESLHSHAEEERRRHQEAWQMEQALENSRGRYEVQEHHRQQQEALEMQHVQEESRRMYEEQERRQKTVVAPQPQEPVYQEPPVGGPVVWEPNTKTMRLSGNCVMELQRELGYAPTHIEMLQALQQRVGLTAEQSEIMLMEMGL